MKQLWPGSLRSLCVIALVSGLAKADINKGDQSVTAALGLTVPVSQIDLTDVGGGKAQAGGPGFAGGFQYLYNVSPTFGIGADFNYLHTGEEQSSTLVPFGDSTVNLNSTIFLAVARVNLKTTGTVIPFVFWGMGINSTTLQINTTPSPGFYWFNTGTREERALINDSESGVAVALGGGVDYYISDRVFFGLEGRFDYLGNADYSSTPSTEFFTGLSGVKGTFDLFNVMGRVGYRFGGSDAASADAAAVSRTYIAPTPAKSPEALPPAAEEPPPEPPSISQTIHDYVVAHDSEIRRDLTEWHGAALNSLLDMLAKPGEDRLAIAMKIQDLSEKYPDIQEFAGRVAALRQP